MTTTIQHFLQNARLTLGLWMLTSPLGFAGFSFIFVFGDGVSNTNNAPTSGGATNYHGNRFCNGRVFAEVLSDWQGVTFDHNKNKSNFGNDSSVLITNVNNLDLSALTLQQRAESLFIVWANNADFVDFTGDVPLPWTNPVPWNTMADTSIANHFTAITTLYNKGARKIVMPNAVDIMRTPFYNVFREDSSTDYLLGRQRIMEYNDQFKTSMTTLMESKPGLEIILPDTFAFFEQVLADPDDFGMIDFEDLNAGGMDSGNDLSLNGPGAQFVFWDEYHPTAKFQMHLAAFFQQIISPVKVAPLNFSGGSGQLSVSNIPLGRAGVIEGSATLQPGSWLQDATINQPLGGNMTNSYTVPATGPRRFYRAAFPVVWTWP